MTEHISNHSNGRTPTSRYALQPAWSVNRDQLRQMISASEQLFTPCSLCNVAHNGSRDSHVSFLDVDNLGGRAYCHFCRPNHPEAKLVQVRRNTYHDVMRVTDLARLYDTTHIQPYVINNGKVIFLRSRPQVLKPNSSGPTCRYCHRNLMDATNRYCSLECKINTEDGRPPLTAADVKQLGDHRRIKIPRKLVETSVGPGGSRSAMEPLRHDYDRDSMGEGIPGKGWPTASASSARTTVRKAKLHSPAGSQDPSPSGGVLHSGWETSASLFGSSGERESMYGYNMAFPYIGGGVGGGCGGLSDNTSLDMGVLGELDDDGGVDVPVYEMPESMPPGSFLPSSVQTERFLSMSALGVDHRRPPLASGSCEAAPTALLPPRPPRPLPLFVGGSAVTINGNGGGNGNGAPPRPQRQRQPPQRLGSPLVGAQAQLYDDGGSLSDQLPAWSAPTGTHSGAGQPPPPRQRKGGGATVRLATSGRANSAPTSGGLSLDILAAAAGVASGAEFCDDSCAGGLGGYVGGNGGGSDPKISLTLPPPALAPAPPPPLPAPSTLPSVAADRLAERLLSLVRAPPPLPAPPTLPSVAADRLAERLLSLVRAKYATTDLVAAISSTPGVVLPKPDGDAIVVALAAGGLMTTASTATGVAAGSVQRVPRRMSAGGPQLPPLAPQRGKTHLDAVVRFIGSASGVGVDADRGGAVHAAKRRCISVDMGDPAAAGGGGCGPGGDGGGATGGGTTLGGKCQPEVTSPLRLGNRIGGTGSGPDSWFRPMDPAASASASASAAAAAAAADSLAAQLALLSPSRIARRSSFTVVSDATDIGTSAAAALLSGLLPTLPGANTGNSEPMDIGDGEDVRAGGREMWKSSVGRGAGGGSGDTDSMSVGGCGSATTEGDAAAARRRVKTRKSRPQQAPMV